MNAVHVDQSSGGETALANRCFPAVPAASVPTVPAATLVELDRLAWAEFGIHPLQVAEQAGSHLAELVRVQLGGGLAGRRVVVAVGPGADGAGALAGARHLANRGASVRVVLASPVSRLADAGRRQLETLLEMAVECCVAVYDVGDQELEDEVMAADAIVDAILGHRAVGEPHDGTAWLVERIGRSAAPLVSLDAPSGIDPDTGRASGHAARAAATLAIGLPLAGVLTPAGRRLSGNVHLADVGLPAALLRRLGLEPGTPFAAGRIVRLEGTT